MLKRSCGGIWLIASKWVIGLLWAGQSGFSDSHQFLPLCCTAAQVASWEIQAFLSLRLPFLVYLSPKSFCF